MAAPDGRLIVTVPAYNWLWSQHDTSWHHYRRYTRRLLRERVRAHGWEPVVEHLLLQLDAAARWPPCARSSACARRRRERQRQRQVRPPPLAERARPLARAARARRGAAHPRGARRCRPASRSGWYACAADRGRSATARLGRRPRLQRGGGPAGAARARCAPRSADLPGGYEVVYVDDGSRDRSAELIEALGAAASDDVVLVQLSRNFGMEVAMSAGLDYARGRVRRADARRPPGPARADPGHARAARERAGRRGLRAAHRPRREPPSSALLATGFYAMMRRLARVPYQGQAGDFRLMSRRVVDTVRAMPERRRFLRGMVAWVGLQAGADRVPPGRAHGRRRRVLPGAVPARLRGDDVVLRRPAEPRHLRGRARRHGQRRWPAPRCWSSPRSAPSARRSRCGSWWRCCSSSGVQLMSIGVLGRYLAHVHDQVLGRPLYLVSRVVGADGRRRGGRTRDR